LLCQPEVDAAVPGQRVQFDERVLVEQGEDALAGGQLALGVNLLDGLLADRVQCFLGAPAQIRQLPRRGVDVDRVLGGWLGRVVAVSLVLLVMVVDGIDIRSSDEKRTVAAHRCRHRDGVHQRRPVGAGRRR
jgi:hypothetical protein